MVPKIDTARLTLRAHTLADFDDYCAMWSDPQVTRYIGGKPFNREECWTRFLRQSGHWALMGFGYWVVREKASNRFVGEVAGPWLDPAGACGDGAVVEAGWVLAPWSHGMRYAREAVAAARAHNVSAAFAAADARSLPFRSATFDSTFCVAVLQHVRDVPMALAELARVTRPGGRVLAVEPDNENRYWYSSIPSGMEAFDLGRRFFTALALARGEAPPAAIGPALPGLFTASGITPLSVDLFPVSGSFVGAPPQTVRKARAEAIEAAVALAPNDSLRRLGSDYLAAVARYGRDATTAGPAFVEIQNAMLFASVGQRPDPA